MVIIFLNDFFRACIELDDLFVAHTRQELMVKVWLRIEANYVWDLPCGVAVDTLASFGVPEFHVAIVRGGKELCTIIIEGYIGDSLRMAIVGTEQLAVMVDIPNLQIQLVF